MSKPIRNAHKRDLIQFAIPGVTVFALELTFCSLDGLTGFWPGVSQLVTEPELLTQLPIHQLFALVMTLLGFITIVTAQITLRGNYSAAVVIRENHQLVQHGIYRLSRNPIYLGALMVLIGLPLYANSWRGTLVSLLLIPVFLNRIRLEEELLADAFKQDFKDYQSRTKRLLPFIY